MKLATWNVNSIRTRIGHVAAWLRSAEPDVVALQELKATEDKVPVGELEDLGYNVAVVGEKAYNGVAVLSRHPIEDVRAGLPGNGEDTAARYLEAWIGAGAGGLRFASVYLPNGNPVDGPKFAYKLGWMDRLRDHAAALLRLEEPVVLAGDFNVCPAAADVHDEASMADDALCRPESRSRFRAVLHLGYTDAFRALHPDRTAYSYWDYGRAFDDGRGLRIDHFLLSPRAADRLAACEVDPEPRRLPKPSDHAPVWCELR